MISVIKNVLTKEDLDVVNTYLAQSGFNTKENHIPLHNNLFEKATLDFGITTYGDMGKEISYIFDKICDVIAKETSRLSGESYGSPILTKSYIMKFDNQHEISMGFDQGRPEQVFRSLVFWNKDIESVAVEFTSSGVTEDVHTGDIIIFPETSEFSRTLINSTEHPLFLSDFWNAPENKSPYPGLNYEDIAWGNPMYDKIG